MLVPMEWSHQPVVVQMDDELSMPSLSHDNSACQRFQDVYELDRVLGAGSFGLVVAVKEISTGRRLAIKIAEWDQTNPSTAV